jgi:hypothetical protein
MNMADEVELVIDQIPVGKEMKIYDSNFHLKRND